MVSFILPRQTAPRPPRTGPVHGPGLGPTASPQAARRQVSPNVAKRHRRCRKKRATVLPHPVSPWGGSRSFAVSRSPVSPGVHCASARRLLPVAARRRGRSPGRRAAAGGGAGRGGTGAPCLPPPAGRVLLVTFTRSGGRRAAGAALIGGAGERGGGALRPPPRFDGTSALLRAGVASYRGCYVVSGGREASPSWVIPWGGGASPRREPHDKVRRGPRAPRSLHGGVVGFLAEIRGP